MDLLRRFNGDVHTKAALKEFIYSVISEEGVEKMMKRQDTSHIADAFELINKAFDKLDVLYAQQQKQKDNSNQAR